MKNHVMTCPPPQNQNEVAKPSGSWQYPPPPLFEDFGGHFHVMCAQLWPVGTATSLGSVDPQTANSISCARLARSTAAVALIERKLNSMRWSSTARPRAREVRSRRATAADAPHTFWPCSGVASLVKMIKERHLQFFWPLLFDFLLKRKVSQAL